MDGGPSSPPSGGRGGMGIISFMSAGPLTCLPVAMMLDADPAPSAARAPARRDMVVEEVSLLLRVARRETTALEELHRVFSPRLFAVAMRMLDHESEAAEAVQDTLVRIWEKSPSYDPSQAAPFTWMYLIVRGLCQDRLRKSGRRIARTTSLPDGLAHIPDPGADPSQAANYRDLIHTVRQSIALMPSADRGLLESLLLGDGTVKELSEATGQAAGTLRVRFHRALQRLRQFCQHLHED